MLATRSIVVFGATGGTGRQVVDLALHNGHHVTAVVRNPDALKVHHERLEIIRGDVYRSKSFEHALYGKDVVISCLGIQKQEATTLYSEGISNIMTAMQAAGVDRLICISAIAVTVPLNSSVLMRFVTKNILQKLFRHTYTDMRAMENILRESHLAWTVIRPPWLRNGSQTSIYRTSINEPLSSPSKLSRADLAHYIVNHLTDTTTFRSRVEISY
jgi:putative NADH-flavin reductase